MQQPTTLEAALRRDRFIVILGLIAVAALAWADMFYLASDMDGMEMGEEMRICVPKARLNNIPLSPLIPTSPLVHFRTSAPLRSLRGLRGEILRLS